MEQTLTIKRKTLLQRYWYLIPLMAIVFMVCAIPAYAVITGFNFTQVGATIFSYFSVGSPSYALYMVGGYSTNAKSNTLAQNLIPIIAVFVVIAWGLKALAQTEGIDGFLKTLLIFVLGSVFLGVIVVILSQLT